jgi:hypothetical protein
MQKKIQGNQDVVIHILVLTLNDLAGFGLKSYKGIGLGYTKMYSIIFQVVKVALVKLELLYQFSDLYKSNATSSVIISK